MSTPPPSSSAFAQKVRAARAIKNDSVDMMLSKPNVTAVGIGYKNGDKTTREPAIIVSVDHKIPAGELREIDMIPREVNGIVTDVVESGPFRALAQVERLRPARPGISLGNVQITAGTFGCVVVRNGTRFVLSNNHVLADGNSAPLGSLVVQPGPVDGGKANTDRIGVLAEFTAIAFDDGGNPAPTPEPGGCGTALAKLLGQTKEVVAPYNTPGANKVDCALCKPDDDSLISPDILGIGIPKGVVLGMLGMAVQKSGRTTSYTRGEIEQIDVTSRIDYGGKFATFTGQLLAGAISQPGDSGSVVLDLNGNVIGLLFAGSNTSTLINPIQDVLEALRVEVLVQI